MNFNRGLCGNSKDEKLGKWGRKTTGFLNGLQGQTRMSASGNYDFSAIDAQDMPTPALGHLRDSGPEPAGEGMAPVWNFWTGSDRNE
jgi:hypothetical protein